MKRTPRRGHMHNNENVDPRLVNKTPLAWHVTIRLEGDGALARFPPQMRIASTVTHAVMWGCLLAFRFVDTHAHLLLSGGRREVGRRIRLLETRLHWALGTGRFEPARIRGVLDDKHLWSAFTYVLRQTERHQAAIDQAHDGSILPDLLGLRRYEQNPVPHVLAYFPRLNTATLRRLVGWPELDAFPAQPEHLVEATAGAFGLPDLTSETPRAKLARRAAVQAVDLDRKAIATLLDVTEAQVSRLRHRPVDAAMVRAVQMQLRLRTALASERIQVPDPT